MNREVSTEIKNIFVKAAIDFKQAKIEEIEFDGNYRVDPDEILFVNFTLPDLLTTAISNPIGIQVLDLKKDEIQALFWVEQKKDKSIRIYFRKAFTLEKC